MSASIASTRPNLHVRGWTDARARRARMFAGLLAVVAAAALWATFQPWYGFATSGPARCDRPAITPTVAVKTDPLAPAVTGVYASGCITGRQIAQQSSTSGLTSDEQQALTQLSQHSTAAAPAVMIGLPRTVTMMLIAAALGILGLAIRNGWICGAGMLGMYWSHNDLSKLESLMTAGQGGQLNTVMPGLTWYSWAFILGWGLLTATTLFVVKHNLDQRHVDKKAAQAAGEPAPMGILDHVAGFVGAKIATGIEAAQKERARTSAAADGG